MQISLTADDILGWRISFEIGWYTGEPFELFGLKLFEIWDGFNMCATIFRITIAHFSIGLHIMDKNE